MRDRGEGRDLVDVVLDGAEGAGLGVVVEDDEERACSLGPLEEGDTL